MSKFVALLGWVLIAVSWIGPLEAQRPNALSFEDGEEGWILLFYGSDLEGWTSAGDVDWRVEGDAIVASSGGQGLLTTEDAFDSFELKLDFRAEPGANSGVFLRVQPNPKNVTTDAYELNIAPPENPFPTGSLVQRVKVEGVEESDEWRSFHIVAAGPHFEVKLDGETILDWTDPNPIGSGVIGLQHNQGRIAFRNIKLRYLD